MRAMSLALGALVGIGCSVGNATVTNVTCTSYGYLPSVYTWDNIGCLTMNGHQYGGAGRVEGAIYTDTAEDPTITLAVTLDNDSTFLWTAYHVNVLMDQAFTISSPFVANPGWTADITQQPLWNGSRYLGQLDFTGGAPVGIGQLFDFSYRITFSGATQYQFTQELVPVPEPDALSLAFGGALFLGGWIFRRSLSRARGR